MHCQPLLIWHHHYSACRYDIIIDTNLKPWLIEVCMGHSSFSSACSESLKMSCMFYCHKNAYIHCNLVLPMTWTQPKSYPISWTPQCSWWGQVLAKMRPVQQMTLQKHLGMLFYSQEDHGSLIVHAHYPIIAVIVFHDWIHHHSCSYILISISQVNASPSLSHTTPSDRVMKTSLINDIINIVLSPSGFPEYASMNSCNKEMQWHRQDTEGSRGSMTREHKELPH